MSIIQKLGRKILEWILTQQDHDVSEMWWRKTKGSFENLTLMRGNKEFKSMSKKTHFNKDWI